MPSDPRWLSLAVVVTLACSPAPGGGTTGGSGGSTGSSSSTGHAISGGTTGATATGGGSSTGGSPGSCAVLGEGTRCALPGIGGVCCGGECTDTSHDPLNCGLCDVACPVGWSCEYGGCASPDGGSAASCPPGTAWAGSQCMLTDCSPVDTSSWCALGDGGYGFCCAGVCAGSCEACGYSCGPAQSCEMADIGGPSGTAALGPACFGDCPAGTWTISPALGGSPAVCLPSSCAAAGLGEGLPCAFDAGANMTYGICCDGACIDEESDSQDCGVCGNACATGSFCYFDGAEAECPVVSCLGVSAETECVLDAGVVGACCGGSCVDESQDPSDCGACGTACPAGTVCEERNCGQPDGGYPGCSESPASCPAGTSCVDGDCLSVGCFAEGQTCAFGPGIAGECCGGRCIDFQTDPQNCGGCGFGSAGGHCLEGDAFPIPYDAGGQSCLGFALHNGPYCLDPTCGCLPGGPPVPGLCLVSPLCLLGDGGPAICCDVGPDGGTCVDMLDDPRNCGGCGFACPGGQGCVNGVCTGTAPACGPGRAGSFCNLDAGPSHLCCPGGGCTDTQSDPGNCGACGVTCDGGCIAGSCS